MSDVKTGQGASGLRKTAVLLASVDPDTASRLLSQMDRTEQERVSLEIARLETSPADKQEVEKTLKDFFDAAEAKQDAQTGGLDQARAILEKIHPPDVVNRIVQTAAGRLSPFGFLQKADKEHLVGFIGDEHPQTVALILAHLGEDQSAAILEQLPLRVQQEIVRRLATMEQISPDVVKQVEEALEIKLSGLVSQDLQKTGGVERAASILNLVPRNTERSILEGLLEDEPDMVEQIRRLMFTFEDIKTVNARGVQTLLQGVETSRLALALKTASPELREKFFKNMSTRAVENIQEEMELIGPVRLSDVEAAQQGIVDVVRQLEEQGELFVEGRGGASEMVP